MSDPGEALSIIDEIMVSNEWDMADIRSTLQQVIIGKCSRHSLSLDVAF